MAPAEWLNLWRGRYQAGPLPPFFAWWGKELRAMMPAGWCSRMWPPRPRLLIVCDAARLVVHRAAGGEIAAEPPLVIDSGEDSESARARVQALLDDFANGRPEGILCLAADEVLHRQVTLPAAAEANLAQALAYEMDRNTPFTAEQVFFDYRLTGRRREENLLNVDLYLTLRETLDRRLAEAARLGLTVHAVDLCQTTTGGAPFPLGLNFLPAERRRPYRSAQSRLNWALAGIALVLLAAVMAESIVLNERRIAQLEERIDELRRVARQVVELRTTVDEARAAAGFLAERRRQTPSALVLLADITGRIPEDTWVQRLQITGSELQLQGLSNGAQRLVELLNESPVLDAAHFNGAITVDQRSNQERYAAAATIDPAATFDWRPPAPVAGDEVERGAAGDRVTDEAETSPAAAPAAGTTEDDDGLSAGA